MALVKCRECGRDVSSEASACPGCGAKPKQPMGRLQAVALIIFGGFVLSIFIPATPSSSSPPPPAPPPELTQEQLEAKAKSNARFKATARVLALVKASMRDPESLKWDRILANEDGTVVCATYRGRNGFGGMNFEHIAYAKGSISSKTTAWNKNCADKSLYDMKYAAYAVK